MLTLSSKLSSINCTFYLIYRFPNTNILIFVNEFTDIIHSINNTNFLLPVILISILKPSSSTFFF